MRLFAKWFGKCLLAYFENLSYNLGLIQVFANLIHLTKVRGEERLDDRHAGRGGSAGVSLSFVENCKIQLI